MRSSARPSIVSANGRPRSARSLAYAANSSTSTPARPIIRNVAGSFSRSALCRSLTVSPANFHSASRSTVSGSIPYARSSPGAARHCAISAGFSTAAAVMA